MQLQTLQWFEIKKSYVLNARTGVGLPDAAGHARASNEATRRARGRSHSNSRSPPLAHFLGGRPMVLHSDKQRRRGPRTGAAGIML